MPSKEWKYPEKMRELMINPGNFRDHYMAMPKPEYPRDCSECRAYLRWCDGEEEKAKICREALNVRE